MLFSCGMRQKKCEDKMFGEADSPLEGESQVLDSGFRCNVRCYLGNAKRCNN